MLINISNPYGLDSSDIPINNFTQTCCIPVQSRRGLIEVLLMDSKGSLPTGDFLSKFLVEKWLIAWSNIRDACAKSL